jgi:flagellar motor switch protein FliG
MNVASVADLNRRQKAAIVVMSLGPGSEGLLKELGSGEVEALATEILQLGQIPESLRDEVLTEFLNQMAAGQIKSAGGLERAAEVLEASLGEAEATAAFRRIEWRANEALWNFVRQDPAKFAEVIGDEHPQVIAFLLTQLDPEGSGRVLASLSEELQAEMAWRIAMMDEISPAIAAAVHRALKPTIAPEGEDEADKTEKLGGEAKVADLLNLVSMDTQKIALESLTEKDEEIATKVRKLMFVFRDILLLDDRAMQRVLKEVDLKDLSLALKTAQDDVKEKIFKNVSERAALTIKEEMDYMGPVKAIEVEDAQDRIIERVRTLEEQGEIVINRGGSTQDALV